jgi:hypothetical protein
MRWVSSFPHFHYTLLLCIYVKSKLSGIYLNNVFEYWFWYFYYLLPKFWFFVAFLIFIKSWKKIKFKINVRYLININTDFLNRQHQKKSVKSKKPKIPVRHSFFKQSGLVPKIFFGTQISNQSLKSQVGIAACSLAWLLDTCINNSGD